MQSFEAFIRFLIYEKLLSEKNNKTLRIYILNVFKYQTRHIKFIPSYKTFRGTASSKAYFILLLKR